MNQKYKINLRELYQLLEIDTVFSIWFSDKVEEFHFVEDRDFIRHMKSPRDMNCVVDYFATLRMANKLSEGVKKVRHFLIGYEEKKEVKITNEFMETLDNMILTGEVKNHSKKPGLIYINLKDQLTHLFESIPNRKVLALHERFVEKKVARVGKKTIRVWVFKERTSEHKINKIYQCYEERVDLAAWRQREREKSELATKVRRELAEWRKKQTKKKDLDQLIKKEEKNIEYGKSLLRG